MKILLSPAKTMNYKEVPDWVEPTQPQFVDDAQVLVDGLKAMSVAKLAKTLAVSQKIAELNYDRFQRWTIDDNQELQPAAWAYSGDVYNGLAIKEFSQADAEFARDSLKILSGLYGIVRPYDLIVPYRLEMRSKYSGAWGKDLYAFWGSKLADQITSEKPGFVLNCASDEYAKVAVPHLKDRVRVVTPMFYKDTPKGPERKALFSKYTRGVMARWAIKHRVDSPDKLSKFNLEGYQYSAELSTADAPAFVAPKSFTLLGRFTKT